MLILNDITLILKKLLHIYILLDLNYFKDYFKHAIILHFSFQ